MIAAARAAALAGAEALDCCGCVLCDRVVSSTLASSWRLRMAGAFGRAAPLWRSP